ncbi:MAG: DUF1508 domain-containing protein [Saprospiraceae bacterium]|nr:DUF1508 domain-containing protein [Saprospiraceae bacterium]
MNDPIQHRDDDYLKCDQYRSTNFHEQGFNRFEQEGKFYFSFIDHGLVVLRSEGYSSEAGRENGISSVQKNMDNDEMYSAKMLPDGRWILSLKAGNHQEIARSCPEQSEEEVMSYLPSQRAAFAAEFFRLASIEAGSVPQEGVAFANDGDDASSKESDDYMICREYEEKFSTDALEDGNFIRFKHENTGNFYFAWVTNSGDIIMRSEAYPTAGGRDSGLESVRKNRDLEERYKIEEQRGLWYLVLKAGNHQEIGRSCPFRTEDEARAWLPSERAKAEALRLAALTAANPILSDTNEEDDYMICREYEEQYQSDKVEEGGFIRFLHENTGKYYFAWYDGDGNVILRSEGYPTAAARDNGMESVRKNREIRERFKTEEKRGLHYLVLKAGNHQEIGRSCPKDSEDKLWAMVIPPAVVAEVKVEEPVNIAAPAAIAIAGTAALASEMLKDKTEYKNPDKSDDYLACDEYKGYAISDKAHNIAFFKHKNGQFYFVVYNKDGSVRLRSEGFKTAQERDQELRGVIKHHNDSSMYETIEKAGFVIKVLKDKTGREVGRSCPEKPGAAIIPPPVVPVAAAPPLVTPAPIAATPKVVPTVAPVASGGTGFNWWWLLPLLLLIPLIFWMKSCNEKKADGVSVVNPAPAEPTPAPVDTVVAQTSPEVAPAPPSCDLNWIFFDFDKYNIRQDADGELQLMAKILKENPTYVGVLKAYADARGDDAYNQRLSENRANSAKAVLVQAGIDANRITISASSESAPIAKNTDDDSGRKFNRRVELFVKDANGNDICKSIPPDVPAELKGN